MTSVIKDCRAKVAVFHYRSRFNSAQSHLLVEEKRKNKPVLVLLLWSAGIASLKNARNESSSDKELPVGAWAQPCLGWEDFWELGKLRCSCALCHQRVKYSGNWSEVPKECSGLFSWEWPHGQERRGAAGAPGWGETPWVHQGWVLPLSGKEKSSQEEWELCFLCSSSSFPIHTPVVGFGLGGPISVW